MKIRVQYYGSIRSLVENGEDVVEIPEGATVEELIGTLIKKHGNKFRDHLLVADGTLRSDARVALDGVVLPALAAPGSRLSGTSKVSVMAILPPIAGG